MRSELDCFSRKNLDIVGGETIMQTFLRAFGL
jgi:hypothetical protein